MLLVLLLYLLGFLDTGIWRQLKKIVLKRYCFCCDLSQFFPDAPFFFRYVKVCDKD